MVLWRISFYQDLSGQGGIIMEGRWHNAGHPVVYLAENPAAALLEVCVHTSSANVPPNFNLLRVEGSGPPAKEMPISKLPSDWPTNVAATRAIGTAWLLSRESVLLQVPNAIVPYTRNFLFNPLHPDASSFRITESLSYPFDMRIKR
jgi:RES domain-containing protein